jgi:hypothetical protein
VVFAFSTTKTTRELSFLFAWFLRHQKNEQKSWKRSSFSRNGEGGVVFPPPLSLSPLLLTRSLLEV